MEKIKWLEKSIVYSFNPKENIFNGSFFKALILGKTEDPFEIKMDYESCEVKFHDKFDILILNNETFIRPIEVDVKEIVNEIKNEEEKIKLDETSEEKNNFVIFEKVGDKLYATALSGEAEVELNISVYFKEAYPDFADNEYIKTITVKNGKNLVLTGEQNRITEVTINTDKYVLESKPMVYFTSVAALKEFFTDIGLTFPNKTDDSLKEKIKEKSLYLKRKFGLLELQFKDFEMYPVFKRLTNLYCLQDLVSYSFLSTGDNNGNSTEIQNAALNLSLGKFSTKDGDNGAKKETLFLPDVIKQKIYEAEEDLKKSIFIDSEKVYWYKKGGLNEEQSCGRLQKCF